jgi:hypothetical protein
MGLFFQKNKKSSQRDLGWHHTECQNENSGLSLNEIANMTCKPLSILESLAAQT